MKFWQFALICALLEANLINTADSVISERIAFGMMLWWLSLAAVDVYREFKIFKYQQTIIKNRMDVLRTIQSIINEKPKQ